MNAIVDVSKLTEEQETELFGEKTARWFQIAVREQVYRGLVAGHRRIAVIQPTGSGKTISSGLILTSPDIRRHLGVVDRPLRVLFASHRHRLLTQAEAVYAAEEDIEIIPHSIMSRLDQETQFDIVVLDEAHHEAVLSFQQQLEEISQAPIIGLTADVNRNDGRLCKFSLFIEPITRDEAVAQGFLAESYINTFVITPDISQVDACKKIVELCADEMDQTMVFLRTKQEALELHQWMAVNGYSSSLLVDISETELNRQLADFEQKKYQFAISCMKLGEGVDVKGCVSVLIGRRMRTRGLLNQMIGRASRNDSDCRVYETINPLASDNLAADAIIGVPKEHFLWYLVRGEWRKHQLT